MSLVLWHFQNCGSVLFPASNIGNLKRNSGLEPWLEFYIGLLIITSQKLVTQSLLLYKLLFYGIEGKIFFIQQRNFVRKRVDNLPINNFTRSVMALGVLGRIEQWILYVFAHFINAFGSWPAALHVLSRSYL